MSLKEKINTNLIWVAVGAIALILLLASLALLNRPQEDPGITTIPTDNEEVSAVLQDYPGSPPTPPITVTSPYEYNPPMGTVTLSTPDPSVSTTTRAIIITATQEAFATITATLPARTPSPPECGEPLCHNGEAIKQVDGWVTLQQSVWYHRINDCEIKKNIDVRSGAIAEIHDVNIAPNGDAWLVRYVWTTYEDNGQTIRGHLERQRVPKDGCIDPEGWERVTADDFWLRKAGITEEGDVIYLSETPWTGAVYKQQSLESAPEEMFKVRFFGGTMSIECSRDLCWFATSEGEVGVFDKKGDIIDGFIGPFYPFFYVTLADGKYEGHSPVDGRVIFEWK